MSMIKMKCDGCGEVRLCAYEEHMDGFCYSCSYEGVVDGEGNPIPPEITYEKWLELMMDE